MNYLVNLENKYKSMYDEFIMYCCENKFTSDGDWDEEAKAMYEELESFEYFCKIFFKINIKDCLPSC